MAIWQFAEGSCLTYNVDGGGDGGQQQGNNTYKVFIGRRGRRSVFGNGPFGEIVRGGK